MFQAQPDPRRGVALAQLQDPLLEGFRGGLDLLLGVFAGGHLDEVEIDLAVGAIQSNDQIEGNALWCHIQVELEVFVFWVLRGLDPATPI